MRATTWFFWSMLERARLVDMLNLVRGNHASYQGHLRYITVNRLRRRDLPPDSSNVLLLISGNSDDGLKQRYALQPSPIALSEKVWPRHRPRHSPSSGPVSPVGGRVYPTGGFKTAATDQLADCSPTDSMA
jgi:hypothetical protein